MPKTRRQKGAIAVAIAAAVALAYFFIQRSDSDDGRDRDRTAAVAVAPLERRPIELRRTYSGALEARTKFVVAPKVAGRVVALPLDISDPVERGDTVAILDSAEFEQDANQAQAELAVAQANLAQSESALEIARREHQRAVALRERGIASEAEFDTAQADLLSREAQVKVAAAQVARARAALEAARIRLGYTTISADWSDGDDRRVVAERYVDAGETVSANQPLLLIVDLNPITAVINVTERDYGQLEPQMEARLTTDSFPGRVFEGRVERIAPVFNAGSRQARVELSLENPEGRLKPGMFVRASISLRREDEATVAPFAAITRRADKQGVFLVDADGSKVSWRPVELGIRSGEWIQLLGEPLSGDVVTLGQHLLDDGSAIVIPESEPAEGVR